MYMTILQMGKLRSGPAKVLLEAGEDPCSFGV